MIPDSYRTMDGFGVVSISLFKARRAPFSWRAITPQDEFIQLDPLPYVIVSHGTGKERVECYCGGAAIAERITNRWNDKALPLIAAQGTAAEKIVEDNWNN